MVRAESALLISMVTVGDLIVMDLSCHAPPTPGQAMVRIYKS